MILHKAKRWCNKHSGMMVLRVVLGLFFMAHGIVKLQDMQAITAFFASIGFPAFLAWFVALAEVIGGAALVLGVFVCLAGSLLAVIQLVAIFKVTGRIPAESFLVAFAMGWGMNLVLVAASLGVAWTGPGRFSLWRGRCSAWCWGYKNCADCRSCGQCPECCASSEGLSEREAPVSRPEPGT